jgi:hypothetical protein
MIQFCTLVRKKCFEKEIKKFSADNPKFLKCGAVPGTLTTVDFGIQTNNSVIDDNFQKQDEFNHGGKDHRCTNRGKGEGSGARLGP